MKRITGLLMAFLFMATIIGCTSNNEKDYTEYIGTWATKDSNAENGGLTLEINITNEKMKILLTSTQGLPSSRIAEVTESIKLTYIENSTIDFDFENDGWGNSGTVVLTFNQDSINCEIINVIEDNGVWGLFEGSYTLIRMNNIHELMTPNQSNYEHYYNPTPTYDTSKSSGILATLGMTEQEFRDSCINLSYDWDSENALLENPGNYIGMHFKYIDDNGIGIKVDSKGVSADGIVCYENDAGRDKIIFDCRDDVYSPTISRSDFFVPYLIFTGIQTIYGTDYLCFNLISASKN